MSIQLKAKAILAATALTLPLASYATNGDQLLGVTATQWGMGGATIAAPQDAATIFVNPAGLAELGIEEVRFDLSPGFMNPPREVNGNTSDSNLFFLPSGAVAFKVNDKLYLGLGLAASSGFGVDFSDVVPDNPMIPPTQGNQQVVTTKGFFKLSPSLAYKVSDKLSLGASLNIGYQSLAMSNPMFTLPQNQQFGFGVTLGGIYHINDAFQLGVSWVSKTNMSAHEFNTPNGKVTMDMDVAQQLGMGLAYKSSGWLVEADIKWINFSDTMDSVDLVTPGGTNAIKFGWDDQIVYSLGVQKQVSEKTQLRAGLNYGASPIEEEDVDNNLGSVAIPELHLSLGATRQLSKKVSGSISYTHAFENELTSSNTTPAGTNTIKISQNVLYLQVAYQY
ncbi:MAG: outer membrane protein transport protein [Proteobacteria bacterium]|nr:outer membrane protein transport protein [Pseudomonadota bacterium]